MATYKVSWASRLLGHFTLLHAQMMAEEPPKNFAGLYVAGTLLVKDIRDGLVLFTNNHDSAAFQKTAIMASMDFLQRWEEWLITSSYNAFQNKNTRIFHDFLLRFAKGSIKAWRCWKIDLQK